MNNLNAFLNPIMPERVKIVVSDRFRDEKGKPVEWELTCTTPGKYKQMRKACTKSVQMPGKKGMYLPETDVDLLLCKLAVECTVFPDLSNAELQNAYKVMGAEELLQTMLLPGEYDEYIAEVQRLNGYDLSFAEKVDEAKN